MKPEEFDKQFLAWLDTQTKNTVDGFDEWRKSMKALNAAAPRRTHDEVIKAGAEADRSVPRLRRSTAAPTKLLADAYEAKGDKAAAMKELERYSKAGGRSPDDAEETGDAAGRSRQASRSRQARSSG